ncbi:MAG: radical SAM protein [bacterium]|nr:radical SAM protein [bacterium]
MTQKLKIKEIQCKSAIGKCGFPGGGFAINPYVGCAHACRYCYGRFIKRFTGHQEPWGSFVDVRMNAAEVLEKQMKSPKFRGQQIYIGTVTDPYQPLETKYKLTRQILEVLINYDNPVVIMTKSALVLRDLDLLKKLKSPEVCFTIATLDENWRKLSEPGSVSVKARLGAAKKLVSYGIKVEAMMGPFWPYFTDPEKLLPEFKKAGIAKVHTESLNTIGGNFTGVEMVLKQNYPKLLPEFKKIFFQPGEFYKFYDTAKQQIELLSKKYLIPTTIHFGRGHAR